MTQLIRSCVVAVGSEILNGHTLDTNSHHAVKLLTGLGTEVFKIMVCADDLPRIREVVEKCKSPILIVSGGLGATHDDITMQVIDYLHEKYRYNRRNIPNNVGSAEGVNLYNNKKQIFFLPGVPSEYCAMLPAVEKRIRDVFELPERLCHSFRLIGVAEKKMWDETGLLKKIPSFISVSSLPSSPGVEIELSLITSDEKKKEAFRTACKTVRETISPLNICYSEEKETLAEVVVKKLKEKNLTLSVAESCTGGLLGSLITGVPGSSAVFKGGVIAYSNDIKEKVIGVSAETLEKHGAVSAACAKEMAEKTRLLFKTDYALATTGIAGPTGATLKKPTGLVYIACATPEETKVKEKQFKQNRKGNQHYAATYCLRQLI